MVRLTIRATDDTVPDTLMKLMQARLAAGATTSSAGEDKEMPSKANIDQAFANVMVT